MKFLRPAVKSGEFTIWVDRKMPGGTQWNPEIERHLRACDIFVLLVSANSMGSNYIIDKELEIARERQATGEIVIYPLLIEPTPKAGVDRVRDFNLRPRDAKPFQSYPLAERNQHMTRRRRRDRRDIERPRSPHEKGRAAAREPDNRGLQAPAFVRYQRPARNLL